MVVVVRKRGGEGVEAQRSVYCIEHLGGKVEIALL